MQAFQLAVSVVALSALLATPSRAVPQQSERHAISGDDVAIYNLAGVMRVEAGSGSDVVVEVTRGGRDAGKLRVETGPLRGRETLRVVYPDDDIVYSEPDFGGNTTLDVRDDGTFNDHEGRRRFGGGHRVRISANGRGLEAHADLRVAVPAGKRVAVNLAVGRVFVSNVSGDLRVDVAAANVTADHVKGSLYVDTGSGDVKLSDAEGDVSLDTGSGNVIVTGARGRQLKLDTGSGDVTAERVEVDVLKVDTGSGNVTTSGIKSPDTRIDTGSGNVRLDLLSGIESLYVDTGSGEVTIAVPAQFGAHVDIETGSGGIELRGISIRATRLQSDHLVGDIGDGKGRVKISTGSGGVMLQRSGS
jgi:lia operon protein LiaG